MSHPTVPLPKVYTFKPTCKKCQNMLGEKLSKLEPFTAVCTLEVVGETRKFTIKNNVDREKVVETTEQEQLSCENHETPTNEKVETPPQIEKENSNANDNDNDNNKEQICERVFKGFEGLEVHELAKTKGLTQLEFTKNLKMTFGDEKNIDSEKECNNKEAPSVQGESKAKDVNKSGELDLMQVNLGPFERMGNYISISLIVILVLFLILTYKMFKSLDN